MKTKNNRFPAECLFTEFLIKPAKKFLFKSTVIMLIFLFAFQPLTPAFAQLLDSGDTIANAPVTPVAEAPAQSPSGNEAGNSAELKPEIESKPAEAEEQAAPAEAPALAQEEPTNNQTQNSPTSQKLPEIDKNTGALNYGYSIAVPPGRNNLQPDLALSYNSNSNDQNSAFGYGWALNILYIQRLNKAGTDSLYSSNYFYSSLDGELMQAGADQYIARTENGSFNKYTFSNNQWTLIAKNGTQYKFGYETASRQDDLANPNNVYKWMLQETRDTNDNYIKYTYYKDAGLIYPLAIKYTGNGSTDGIFEINFQRISRTDNAVSYATGFAVNSNYLINEIYAKINNDWVSKYVLNYSASLSASRSLLNSVILSGKDSAGNITALPATTFNYQNLTAGFISLNAFWDIPTAPNGFEWNLYSRPPQFADLNEDGLQDLVIIGRETNNPLGNGLKDFQYFNTGYGWSQANDSFRFPSAPEGYNWNLDSKLPQFADLNGDGLQDLIMIAYGCFQKESSSFCEYKDQQYLNNGNGWTQASGWNIPVLPEGESAWQWYNIPPQFTDLNGDGLIDIVLVSYRFINQAVGGVRRGNAYFNNGNGWTKTDDSFYYPSPPEGYGWDLHSRPPQFADLNADGLPDLIMVGQETSNPLGNTIKDFQYLNTGTGWTQTSAWSFPALPDGETAWQYPAIPPQYADLNGDGLIDIVLVSFRFISNAVGGVRADNEYLNTGSGWTKTPVWKLPALPEGDWNFITMPPQFVDINSDGLQDIFAVVRGPDYNYKNYEYLNAGQKQDLLMQINYPQGGNSVIGYKTAAQYTDSAGNLVNKSPYPIFTVSQITNSDGFGNSSSFSYHYQGMAYYYNGPFDRNLAGFAEIIQTDSAKNITKTFYHTNENYFKIGKPYKVEQYDSAGNLFLASINKWEATNLAGNAGFVKLAQTTEQNFSPSAGSGQVHKDKAESYVYDDATGNQTQKTEWGEVVANSSGNFSDVGADKRITNINYAFGSNVVGSWSNIIVLDQNNNKIKESRYYYDNLTLGNISLGNQTKEENWIGASNYINAQKTYNSYGLVVQSKDPNNNATIFTYDSYNLYSATVKNALNQTAQFIYNYANGKPIQTTDANGNIFKNTFDGFGRILKTEQPDQVSPATLVIKTIYIYTDAPLNTNVQQTNYLDFSNFVTSYNYYDGLGRVIQTKKSAENNNFETKDFVYDNRGNLQKESLPYFSQSSAKTNPSSETNLFTNYAYDALNRKISIVNAVGTTGYAYKNWQTTITDANQNKKDFIYNAYNNLIQVNEYNAGNVYTTVYTYDTAGNLIKITDALQNIRNFSYDGLGRKLSAEDLHKPADSVFGIFNYIYDNAGNLTRITDPKNQIINYSYDALNRKITEDYSGGEGVEVNFSYDNCPNGKGLLCDITSTSQTEQYEYSALGNITKSAKTIDAKNYITAYSFDRQGNQTLITNPDSSQIKYDFNAAGLIEKVWRKESADAGFLAVINNLDYSPAEQIADVVFANGTQTINTYDSAKLYRLTNKITANATGTQLQNLAYTYDPVGNITQLADNSATDSKKTVAYTYDNLYRLTSAVASNTANSQNYTQNFVYDALGNILSQTTNNQTTTYEYSGANPDAVTKTVTTGVAPLPVIAYFVSSPSEITSGKSTVLSWAVSGGTATTLSIDNNIGSVLGLNFKIVNPAETTTYVLTAENDGGTATKSVTITVNPVAQASMLVVGGLATTAKAPPIINFFNALPATITKGKSAVLSWTLSGGKATSLTIDNNVGSVLGKTSKTVSPTATKIYKLTARNSYGSTTKSIVIAVNPQPPIISKFAVSPTTITLGNSATLSWTLSGGIAKALSIDNGIGSVLGKTKFTVKPTITTTYTITAVNISGTITKSVTVIVNQPSPIINSFTASSKIVAQKQQVTFSWTLAGGAPTTLSIDNGVGSVLGLTSKTITPTATTYTLTAKNTKGTATKSVTIIVNPPSPIINSFTADYATIIKGQSITLSWILSGGEPVNLSIDNSVGSVLGATSKTVTPTTTATYTLTASNITGAVTKSVTVTVNPLPPDISSFVATPNTIMQGQSATLSWSLSGGSATTLSIDNNIGNVLGATSKTVTPTVTTTYTLTATNVSGSSSWSVAVIVNIPPPIINSFTADSLTITKGQSATLSWVLSGGKPTSLSINNYIGSVLGKTSKTVSPTATTTYNLTAENDGGSITKSVTITVTAVVAPVISTFTVVPATAITAGQSAILSWTLLGSAVTKLNIDNGVGSVLGKTSITVKPTVTTTYVLTATNTAGAVIKPVTVEVAGEPAPTTITKDYTYDTNGNMTSDATNPSSPAGSSGPSAYEYDYNNRLAKAITPNSTIIFAYDPQGQRIKYAVDGATPTITYYPSMYYNVSDTATTKHIFANGLNIATINGTGATAKVYYATTDSLNSSTVMTDSAGAVAETLDYFPFGQIRIDKSAAAAPAGAAGTAFSEQRKYIGQEFDEDTGLNYLNARYYNATLGRFTSQDPMFWNFDQAWLSDPQTQNAYSYARNNPITLSDPKGEKVELISRPVFNVGGHILGSHVFWSITPDNPNEININGLASGTKEFTFSGYQSDNRWWSNKLIKQIGTTETSIDKKWAFDGESIINKVEIKPLEGQTDSQLINSLGKAHNDINLKGMNYRFAGNYEGLYDGNSNNFAYTVGVNAGVKDQMDAFHPNPNVIVGGKAPGYGTMLPNTSLPKQIQEIMTNIQKSFNEIIKSYNKK